MSTAGGAGARPGWRHPGATVPFSTLAPARATWRWPMSVHLPASVMDVPDGDELAAKLRSHGLSEVRWHSFTFGIATLYVGTKKPASPGAETAPELAGP